MAIRPITFLMSIVNSQNMKSPELNQYVKNIQETQMISEQNLKSKEAVSRISHSDFESDEGPSLIRQGLPENSQSFQEETSREKKENAKKENVNEDKESFGNEGSTIDIIT